MMGRLLHETEGAFVHNQKRSDFLKSSRRSEKEGEVRGDEEIRRSSDLDVDSLDWDHWSSELQSFLEQKYYLDNMDSVTSKRMIILVKSCCC